MTAYNLVDLPYAVDALEPYIDATTMQLHHDRHMGTYVSNLNKIIEDYGYTNLPECIFEFIGGIRFATIDSKDRSRLVFNAGGVANHQLFFSLLDPSAVDSQPEDELAVAINANFGSFEKLQEEFLQAAMGHLGSGWAWLCVDPSGKKIAVKDRLYPTLFVSTTNNHDNPSMIGISEPFGQPILCLDLWEHAYYLKYQNRKREFFDNFWKIVSWKKVAELYDRAKCERF